MAEATPDSAAQSRRTRGGAQKRAEREGETTALGQRVAERSTRPSRVALYRQADERVLARYGPPGVVVDHALRVVQVRGDCGPLLSTENLPTRHLLRAAHPAVRPALRTVTSAAKKHNRPARREGIVWRSRGDRQTLAVEVTPLTPLAPPDERFYLVIFEGPRNGTPAPPPQPPRKGAQDRQGTATEVLERELLEARNQYLRLVDEFRSLQQELTTANAQLHAANEDLRSGNEALESAREALQVSNEALSTLNDELTARNAEVNASNEKLARGEDRFRLLVDSVKDYAIFMLDPQSRVASWNEGARRLNGYEARDVLGQHLSIFYPSEDIESGKVQRELDRALGEGRVEDEGWRVRKDGTRYWASSVITRVDDPQGGVLGFTKVLRDLTEHKRAEQALRSANDSLEGRFAARTAELQDALGARDEFLSIASHELKTPLTGLKLQLQLGRRGVQTGRRSTESTLDALDRSLKQALALEGLVEDLLDVSRTQTGRLLLDPQQVDVTALVDEVVTRSSTQFAHALTPLVIDLPPAGTACWDRRRIIQVLSNLLANALKYAPRSPVRVGVEALDERVRLTVTDGGPGISPAKQAVIFDRFERAGASVSVAGLGLGLYIARRIVEAHHGSIRVENPPGQGARFVVELPREGGRHEG
jgi:PAS domain S-box-containing protein